MSSEPSQLVRIIRDFVNSAEPQLGTDQLTPATAAECLQHLGLLADAQLAATDLPLLIGVREGLRAVLSDHAGHSSAPAVIAELDGWLRKVPVTSSLASGIPVLTAVKNNAAHRVVAAIISAVIAVPADDWARLKVCARDSCRWAFYDASRNRSGRWCSMAGCGNIVKMRRAHRTQPAGSHST